MRRALVLSVMGSLVAGILVVAASPGLAASVPNAPRSVVADPGNGSATVSWLAPASDNGSPITGYVVSAHGPGAQPVETFMSTDLSQTVGGLPNGALYTFTVAAINAIGTGPGSSQSAAIRIGTPGAPAPTSVVAGSLSATVSWTIPTDNGSPIIEFKVQMGTAGSYTALVNRSVAPTQTSLNVTGLAAGQSYWVRVKAINGVGHGPFASAGGVVPLGGVPGTPLAPGGIPGDGSATVSWEAPYDGGSSITGYAVTPFLGAVAEPTQTFSSSALSQSVVGLTNGETYTFTVAAINANGTGSPSAASAPVLVGSPVAPRSVVADPGNGSATVSWLPPAADNGAAITGYIVSAHASGGTQPTQTFMSTDLSQTMAGLTNGPLYTFTVAAINAIGTGPESSPSSAIRVGTPDAPAPASVVAGSLSATVSWTIPTDNGSPITSFTVLIGKAGSYYHSVSRRFISPTDTSVTVTGLAAGQSYWVQVKAINGFGPGPYAYAGAVTPNP